jgi:hypothetical protein
MSGSCTIIGGAFGERTHFPVTFGQCNGTFGSLTFRSIKANVGQDVPPSVARRGDFMKLIHVCYAALGFAVARWFFRREAIAIADPVARLRTSGLL